jgi:hypothetical protein
MQLMVLKSASANKEEKEEEEAKEHIHKTATLKPAVGAAKRVKTLLS